MPDPDTKELRALIKLKDERIAELERQLKAERAQIATLMEQRAATTPGLVVDGIFNAALKWWEKTE